MNRPIKFRAWNKGKEKWLLGYEYKNLGGFSMFGEMMMMGQYSGLLSGLFSEKRMDDLVLMQYTGLKDKNGQEIYEKDIVNSPEGIYSVEWNQLHCSWGLFTNSGQSENMLADWVNEDGSTPNQWEDKSLEIIGNVFENPNLIEN